MNYLYIAEDYLTTRVHHHLCEALTKQDIHPIVFTVERNNKRGKLPDTPSEQHYTLKKTTLQGSELLYKYVFPYKISTKYKLLKSQVDLTSVQMVHAATLFSEGALAYKLFKKHHIPYMVAVRGSDLFFYLEKMPHLWPLGRKILKHAKKIFFITPNAQQRALHHPVLKSVREIIAHNSIVIPNGIDSFWTQNIAHKQSGNLPQSILYVGNFEHCKNIPVLIETCRKARLHYPTLQLSLVGGGGSQQAEVESLIKKHSDWITFTGSISDKEQLKEIYRKHDLFAMVSYETFGLVYVEALTQGLPLIYAKGSGFDGMYEEGIVGYSTELENVEHLTENIKKTIVNYDTLIDNISHCDFNRYNWDSIAEVYAKILGDCLR